MRQGKHRRVATVGVLGAAAAGSTYRGALHRKGCCIEGSRRSVATGQMMAGAAGSPSQGACKHWEGKRLGSCIAPEASQEPLPQGGRWREL